LDPRVHRFGKAALRITISAVALYLVFQKVDAQQLTGIIETAQPAWLLAGLMLYAFSKLTSSVRLTQYFHANEIPLTELSNLRLYWIGMFYNLFLPGGIGGDAYKVWVLHRDYDVSATKAFQSVFFDRISGLFMLAMLACLTAWFAFPQAPWTFLLLPSALLALIGLVLVHYLFAKAFLKIILSTTLYSLVVQLIQMACAWTLLRALGITENTGAYLAVFLVSSAAAVLPITIGGIGIRELVFITAALYAPVSAESSVAFSLLFFALTVVSSLPGAFVQLKATDGVVNR